MECKHCTFGIEQTIKIDKDDPEALYLRVIECPFDTYCYKYPDQKCDHEEDYRIRRNLTSLGVRDGM